MIQAFICAMERIHLGFLNKPLVLLQATFNCLNVNALEPAWTKWPHFANNIVKCILLNEKYYVLILNFTHFVPKGPFNNKAALVQVMAWHSFSAKAITWTNAVLLLNQWRPESLTIYHLVIQQVIHPRNYTHSSHIVLFCLVEVWYRLFFVNEATLKNIGW